MPDNTGDSSGHATPRDPAEDSYFTYSELLAEEHIGWPHPIAIYPQQRNPRHHAQRGWFTTHGNDLTPIDEIPEYGQFAQKVILPRSAIAEAREFLKIAGIDHYLLHSDLGNLSLLLREKNGLT